VKRFIAALRRRVQVSLRVMRHAPLKRKMQDLQSPQMQALVKEAASLEPGILFPGGPRKTSLPPYAHDAAPLLKHGRLLEQAAGSESTQAVVLVASLNHMSGAARCGLKMAQALQRCMPGQRILLVPTEAAGIQLAPPGKKMPEVLDFASIVPPSLPLKFRCLLLLDMLRGLQVRCVINANSALGWDLLLNYGRQLRHWADLYAYMFCWDVDRKGRRKGYPLQQYPAAFSLLNGAFFDSHALREEIVQRHMLPPALQQRLLTIHTPMDMEDLPDLTAQAGARFAFDSPVNALWAGRFDKQKRPDLAMQIARLVPDMRLHMYGRRVFGGVRINRFTSPRNLLFKGSYRTFGDLPLHELDFLLYTSRWDGLPTVIIEAAVSGLPIVAPLIGGIGDLLDDSTAWLVPDPDDVHSYVRTIHNMLANPQLATAKARALRERALKLCNEDRYVSHICGFLSQTRQQLPPGERIEKGCP